MMPNKKLLSPKQQAAVEERLRSDSATPDKNASATVWELIARKTLAANERSKDPLFRKNRRLANLTDDQLVVVCMTGKIARDGLFPPASIGDGILRRFAMNSPLELALRLSIGARYHWASSQWSGNSYADELFRPILQAIAARDFIAAEHLARMSPPSIAKPNNRSYASIFMGVVALMQKDRRLLQDAVGRFTGSDPAYIKSLKCVLAAVADDSAKGFADGMNSMLSAYRRYMFSDEVYGLVDPHAMGLFELCKRFSPTVVAEFDIERKLPWDSEYFAWSQQVDDIRVYFDVEAVPEAVRPLLFDFEPLPWGKDVLANWHSG